MNNKIVKSEGLTAIQALRSLNTLDADDTLSILKTAVKEGTTGLVTRGLSLIQRWNSDRFFEAFLDEVEDMMSAGRVNRNLQATDVGVASVREFFKMIDGEPDEKRFHAFCALFMSANAPGVDSNEVILDLELMGILRKLTAGEMHLLSAFLKVRTYTVGQGNLLDALANELGYKSSALVYKNVTALIENGLIDRGTWTNLGGTVGTEKRLLTDLSAELITRIEKYLHFKGEQTS